MAQTEALGQPASGRGVALMGMAAMGVVFGDIGTSPLYTLKTVLEISGKPDAAAAMGSLSLIVWTLFIITSLKYVAVAMRIDNDGEGGILALMSLLGVKGHRRPTIIAIGLFGAALIYGDGAITPAISVLSALEGLEPTLPSFTPYVLPLAVLILIGLFAAQPLGTQQIGRAFGPIMLVWFIIMAVLGLIGIAHNTGVLFALNPYYGLTFLFSGGIAGFLVLGGVFLCVTGAEALYADLGHFGPAPIRAAWNFVVFPSLILNYAGQTALVLNGQSIEGNIFFALCPDVLLTPYVLLATVATIIASQSIITGAFSMTRQAIQLGALPRLKIVQTSEEGYGQIYVGAVNWLLMIVTVALTIGFGKSDNLAAAYGIAVSLTMLMTSVLLFIAMREIWNWSVPLAGAVAGGFLIVDAAFFAANLVKVFDGGYVPLVLAGMICVAMWVWRRGTNAVRERVHATETPIDQLMVEVESQAIPRVPGTAVFLSRAVGGAPPVLVWHLKHNRSLHAFVYVLHIDVASTPRVNPANRLVVKEAAPNFWRAEAHYGFMEHPDVTTILRESSRVGCPLDLSDVTYFVGHETIVQRDDGKGLPHWMVMVFAAMTRNASRINDFLDLPTDQVVEIGRQVAI